MAEDAVESAGAKAPAITFLINDSSRAMENMIQSYLFIGGNQDGLNISVSPDQDTVQLPAGATAFETSVRDTLADAGVGVSLIYRIVLSVQF